MKRSLIFLLTCTALTSFSCKQRASKPASSSEEGTGPQVIVCQGEGQGGDYTLTAYVDRISGQTTRMEIQETKLGTIPLELCEQDDVDVATCATQDNAYSAQVAPSGGELQVKGSKASIALECP
jgi:hypothetical protein